MLNKFKAYFEKLGVFQVELDSETGAANILDVDIFELGEAKGFDYTEAWAEAAIGRFQERKNENGYRPPIIVGHNTDGFFPSEEKPAQGFMDNFKLKSKKLYADLIKIPKELYQRLEKGEFPYRSLEIVPAEFAITAIALLGGTEPFFKLTPLANFSKKNGRAGKSQWLCHGIDDTDETELFSINQIREISEELAEKLKEHGYETYRLPASLFQKEKEDVEMPPTKEELEALNKKIEADKLAFDARVTEFNKLEAETKVILEKFKKQEEELKKSKDEAFKKEIETFMAGQVEKGKLSPAMRDSLQAILFSCGAVTVKFGAEDKSVLEMVKKFLSDIPETINFSTVSKDGKDGKEKTDMEKHEEFVSKISEFQKANPTMKYGDILRKITADFPELAGAYQKFHSANAPKVAA